MSNLRPKTASEGMVLTNGEAYSDADGTIYLGVNDSPDNWYEITAKKSGKITGRRIIRGGII